MRPVTYDVHVRHRLMALIVVLLLVGFALDPIGFLTSMRDSLIGVARAIPFIFMMLFTILFVVDQVLKYWFGESLRQQIQRLPHIESTSRYAMLWQMAAALIVAGALCVVALK